MAEVRIQLPELHPGQLDIKNNRNRFNVLDCGRRFGKNLLLQDLGIETALAQGQPLAWAAPTYKSLMKDWDTLNEILRPVLMEKDEKEHQNKLIGGGSMDFYSLDSDKAIDSIRGNMYARFIVNEAAFVPRLLSIVEKVIRPTLIDLRGDAYYAGTPKGRNDFWTLYNRSGPEWSHWKKSSYENPHIPASELDALRSGEEAMTERAFHQEILAEFLEDGGAVFRYIDEASIAILQTKGVDGHGYIFGIDWGKIGDFTVVIVIDVNLRSVVFVDRFNALDYVLQLERIRTLVGLFSPYAVIAERNSIGEPLIEQMVRMNIPIYPFMTTNASKINAVEGLVLAFEQRDITIVPDQILINELQTFESGKTPSGLTSYGAPAGMHDDCVMALAIAWSGIQNYSQSILAFAVMGG